MTLNDLALGETWMDPEEHQTAAELVLSLQQLLAERQIPENLLLLLRVRDLVLHHTLCLRLERNLTPDPRHSHEDGSPAPATVAPVLAGHIGRTRDRLRKSLKDFEDSADKFDPTRPSSKTSGKGKSLAKGEASPEAKPCTPLHNPKYIQNLIEEVGIDLNDEEFFADEDNFYDLPLEEQLRLRPETAPKTPEAQAILARLNTASIASQPDPAQNTPIPSSLSTVNYPRSTPPDPAPSAPPAQTGDRSSSVTPVQAGAQPSSPPPDPPESSSASEPHSSHGSHMSHSSPDSQPFLSDPAPDSSLSAELSTVLEPVPPLSTVNYQLSTANVQAGARPPDAVPDASADQNPLPPKNTPDPKPWRSPIPPTPPPIVYRYKVKPTPFNKHLRYD